MAAEATREEARTAAVETHGRSLLLDTLVRLVKEKPLGTVGGVMVLFMFFVGIFANVISPYDYNEMMPAARLGAPSTQFWMGTDHLGRDMLSRIIYGARISMIIGLSATSIATVFSLVIGIISGYFGGKADVIIQRFVDAWMCIPGLFILLTIMSILGPGLWQVIVVMGPFYGIRNSRVIRSAVIGIKENMYVDATRALGAPASRVIIRHILPNILAPVIILYTIYLGSTILTEATISFLGFGIPPPIPAWGAMLSESGRRFLLLAPWMAVWPGLALSFAVYGINMLGDGLRDVLDPRLRGGLGRYGGAGKKVSEKKTKKSSE